MNIPKKKYNEQQFIKYFLLNMNKGFKCDFCKYHMGNYEPSSTGKTAALFFIKSKCNVCIHYFGGHQNEKKPWIRDQFKPLYEWQENEGEQHE